MKTGINDYEKNTEFFRRPRNVIIKYNLYSCAKRPNKWIHVYNTWFDYYGFDLNLTSRIIPVYFYWLANCNYKNLFFDILNGIA